MDAQAAGQRDRCRTQAATTWMLRPPVNATAVGQSGQRGSRAARPFWSESGGRGGVSDLGGGEQRVDVGVALGQDAECRPLRS